MRVYKHYPVFNKAEKDIQEMILAMFERRFGMKGDTWVEKYPDGYSGLRSTEVYTSGELIEMFEI